MKFFKLFEEFNSENFEIGDVVSQGYSTTTDVEYDIRFSK